MGAIKDNNYTEEEWMTSNFSRAFAHPARRRMIRTLLKREVSNLELSEQLNLNRKTIKEHIDKLQDANLIGVTYQPHFYIIYLNEDLLEAVTTQLRIYRLLKSSAKARHIR